MSAQPRFEPIDPGVSIAHVHLKVTLRRLADSGIRLDGASDHGVSEALYRSGRERRRALPRPPAGRVAGGPRAGTTFRPGSFQAWLAGSLEHLLLPAPG